MRQHVNAKITCHSSQSLRTGQAWKKLRLKTRNDKRMWKMEPNKCSHKLKHVSLMLMHPNFLAAAEVISKNSSLGYRCGNVHPLSVVGNPDGLMEKPNGEEGLFALLIAPSLYSQMKTAHTSKVRSRGDKTRPRALLSPPSKQRSGQGRHKLIYPRRIPDANRQSPKHSRICYL